jgi:hypothetical protein
MIFQNHALEEDDLMRKILRYRKIYKMVKNFIPQLFDAAFAINALTKG